MTHYEHITFYVTHYYHITFHVYTLLVRHHILSDALSPHHISRGTFPHHISISQYHISSLYHDTFHPRVSLQAATCELIVDKVSRYENKVWSRGRHITYHEKYKHKHAHLFIVSCVLSGLTIECVRPVFGVWSTTAASSHWVGQQRKEPFVSGWINRICFNCCNAVATRKSIENAQHLVWKKCAEIPRSAYLSHGTL